MRRAALRLVGPVCFVALLVVIYRPAWFEDGQFVGGNVSYHFYPLYLRVQQEWEAGRWPLWDPGHNAGEPLLGNPIAAVLYPGKALYAWLPYAWAARLYVIGHTVLAFFGLLALGRSLGVSWAGSCLGGLSYAFGAPILLQYGNPCFLVGAAWIPWALCAIDRLLRQGRRRGVAELAAILALQVLGGDPGAAYLTAACGAGYAFILAIRDSRDRPGRLVTRPAVIERFTLGLRTREPRAEEPPLAPPYQGGERERVSASEGSTSFPPLDTGGPGGVPRSGATQAKTARPAWPVVLGVAGLWIAATLGLSSAPIAWPGFLVANGLVLAAWVAVVLGIAWSWYRHPGEARLAPRLAWLMAACILAMALAAAQLLPGLEFIGQTWRAGGITATVLYQYSLDPCRLVELVWPNVFGTSSPENRSWLQAVPPVGGHELWIDSLYLGGLALVLALSAAGWRGGPPWRAWLTTLAVVGLAASLGKYGSPLWWARWGPFTAVLGPHDPLHGEPRADRFLPDGAGSPYGLLAMLLPGFGALRYPSKFLPIAAVSLAVLAGAGWDRVARGETRGLRRLSLTGLGASLVGLVAAWAAGGSAVTGLTSRIPGDPMFGPADAAGAWVETERALAHGAIGFAMILALAHWAPRRPRGVAAMALLLLTADLALANSRLIRTVPQAEFDAPAQAARLIEAAERSDPSSGPFRIHRMSGGWLPAHFATTPSADRFRELTAWARQTLYPLVAVPLGLEYCATIGSLELEDYVAFFHPQRIPVSARMARLLGVPAGQRVVYFPRRSFDLWDARYFLLPAFPDWASPERGFASFLDQTELIHPGADVLYETHSTAGQPPWALGQDWQLRRNRAAYPRAWIVHSARVRSPAPDPDTRARWTGMLVYRNDPIWSERDRPVVDLRQTALIETNDKESLRGSLSGTPVGPSESVAIIQYEPQRIELRATLDQPGLVILADAYYPGWHLTIDGRPAPILRANRMMRGAAVPAGRHTLVYTYDPLSFRLGAIASISGLIALLGLAWSTRREPSMLTQQD